MKWIYILVGLAFAAPLGAGSWFSAVSSSESSGFLAFWWAVVSVGSGLLGVVFIFAAMDLFSKQFDKDKRAA